MELFNKLQVQGYAYTVDKDDALVQALLIRDIGIHELFEGGSRADELDRFGSALCIRREFVQYRKVEELEFHIPGNPV